MCLNRAKVALKLIFIMPQYHQFRLSLNRAKVALKFVEFGIDAVDF